MIAARMRPVVIRSRVFGDASQFCAIRAEGFFSTQFRTKDATRGKSRYPINDAMMAASSDDRKPCGLVMTISNLWNGSKKSDGRIRRIVLDDASGEGKRNVGWCAPRFFLDYSIAVLGIRNRHVLPPVFRHITSWTAYVLSVSHFMASTKPPSVM